jgi:predicted  nucleic acid-binding Zn-ribbon protein
MVVTMTDVIRELHLLVSIAKMDAELHACRTELSLLPEKIESVKRSVEKVDKNSEEAVTHLDGMRKERRALEKTLANHGEKIKKLKTQLMEVKTNKEYTAMLSEIEHTEKGIDEGEERLLMLMDELDQQTARNKEFMEKSTEAKTRLLAEQSELENRLRELQEQAKRLEAEKPKVLKELDPQTRKRYDRILAKYGDIAVALVADEACQGCHSRIPPQTILEVKSNEQIITCQTCGRILVYYTT